MTTVSYQIVSSPDDCVIYDDGGGGTGFDAGTTMEYMGAHSGGYLYKTAMRFTGVQVPKDATITSAKITFKVGGQNTVTDCFVRLAAEAADNPAVITSFADFNSRSLTTAHVDWTILGWATLEASVDTPDLATIIQEIVDRAGWTAGNALTIFANDNGSTLGAMRCAYSFDGAGGVQTRIPTLTIAYTTSGTTVTIMVEAGLGGSVSPSGSQILTVGETYMFTASPSPNYTFDHYTLNSTNEGADVVLHLLITAGMDGETLMALFTSTLPTASVEAIPDTGYELDRWELDGSNVGKTNPYVVTMTEDHTLKAWFKLTYTPPAQAVLTLTTTPTIGGTVTPPIGMSSYDAGTNATLTATAGADYVFASWEIDGLNVGNASPYTLLMDVDHDVKAVFTATPPISILGKPALVRKSDGSGVWMVVAGTDTKIYVVGYDRATDAWGRLATMPGTTDMGLAAAMLGENLYIVRHDADDSLSYGFLQSPNLGLDSNRFSGWSTIPGCPVLASTVSAPAMCGDGTSLYLTIRNKVDDAIYYCTYTAGAWSAFTDVGVAGATDAAPAIGIVGTRLVVSVKGLGTNGIWYNVRTGGVWGGWTLEPLGASDYSHTVASDGSNLYLCAIGATLTEWYNVWDGVDFGSWTEITGKTTTDTVGAALLTYDATLELHVVVQNGGLWHIIIKGSDGSIIRAWVQIPNILLKAVTLGGYVLSPEAPTFHEEDDAEALIHDVWTDATYSKHVTIFRSGKTWLLRCYEQNVNWTDSVAKLLETDMTNPLPFIIDIGALHQVNVDVYVKRITVTYEDRVRIYDLELQEKED